MNDRSEAETYLAVLEFLHAVPPAFTAEPGFLDAAKGCSGIGHDASVDTRHAHWIGTRSARSFSSCNMSETQTLQSLCCPPSNRQILRVDVCRETDFGMIRLPHNVFLRIEPVDSRDWSEYLRSAGLHLGRHVA